MAFVSTRFVNSICNSRIRFVPETKNITNNTYCCLGSVFALFVFLLYQFSQAWTILKTRYETYGVPEDTAFKARVLDVLKQSRITLIEHHLYKACVASYLKPKASIDAINLQVQGFSKADITILDLQPVVWESCSTITAGGKLPKV